MGKLAVLWRIANNWYVAAFILSALGIALGLSVFFVVFPGQPKIGVIDIPFTSINESSTEVITSYLEYAREQDDIKAVIINLTSPGGGAADSERLFLMTRALREEKPVVISMNGIVASGGYMMSMGANYTFAMPTSLVGSVGVVLSFVEPLIPEPPSERLVVTGPAKLSGGTRRQWIATTDQIKQAFAQVVLTQRGDRLKISADELLQARIYSGVEAVRLGLVDAIGGETEALDKAASLAGISGYELVDVNTEVFRLFFAKIARVLEPLRGSGEQQGLVGLDALTAFSRAGSDSAQAPGSITALAELHKLLSPMRVLGDQEDPLPGLPLEISGPNIYFIYVGPSQ